MTWIPPLLSLTHEQLAPVQSFLTRLQLRCPVCRGMVSPLAPDHEIYVNLTADGTRADCYVARCRVTLDTRRTDE